MSKSVKTKAEEKYAELKRKDTAILTEIEKSTKLRADKTARLKKLRLEKEEADRIAEAEAPPKPAKQTKARAAKKTVSA